MHLLELFPTIVGVFVCEHFDQDAAGWRAEVAKVVAEREESTAKPQHQTEDRLHERPELAKLIAFFQRSAAEYMQALQYRSELELRLQCCWATIAVGGDRFEMHQHANSFLSGAFYLSVAEGAKPVIFRDPRPQNRTLDIPVEQDLRINRKYYSIDPSNGQLVLFPSWLEHRVRPSFSDVPRVSLSFNMTLHGELGSTGELTRASI